MNTEAEVIHIVPRVVGAGGNGILQTVLGAVMVVWGFSNCRHIGGGAPLGAALIGSGIGMMLGGVHDAYAKG